MDEFYDKYKAKIATSSAVSVNGLCIIWNGTKQKDGRYGVISYKCPVTEKWKTMHVHRLSKLVHTGTLSANSLFDCSHICHNSLCVSPDHLNFEPRGVNNQRQACVNAGKCHGHHTMPECLIHLQLDLE